MKPLILVGGGGHCKSVIDVAESAGYNILGILDKQEFVGTAVLGYPILGTDDEIPKYADKVDFVVTSGQIKNTGIRRKIESIIEKAGGHFATVIAEDAYVSEHAVIGDGTVVLHKAVVNAGAEIGKNCIINTMVNIEHDVYIGDCCHISTGTMVNGGTKIGNDCFVGSGCTLYNGIKIADGSVVPAGIVVRKSIE